jgi:acyl-CoA thioesterase FadM
VTETFPWVQRCEPEHQIWTAERLVTDAKSVLVGYDYTAGASVPLTENQKRRLAA